MSRLFPYALDMKFAPMWLPFGVRPTKDGVTMTEGGLFKASFGFIPRGDSTRQCHRGSYNSGLPVVDRHRGSEIVRR